MGLRQVNTCHQVPIQVNFYEKPTFRVWGLYRYLVMGGGGGGGELGENLTQIFDNSICVSSWEREREENIKKLK
jgi:hypothetical protein